MLSATGSREMRRKGKTNPFFYVFFNSLQCFKDFEAAAELMPDPQARHSSYTSDSSPRSRKALKQRRFPSETHFQKHCNVQMKSTLKHQSLKKRG